MVLTEEEKLKRKREYNRLYAIRYREKNVEKTKKYQKEYNKTEEGKKSNRISNWKKNGVIHDDFNSLYDRYLNCKNCEECNVELIQNSYSSNRRCLDHDHKTGLFRNVVCNTCNFKRGILERTLNKNIK